GPSLVGQLAWHYSTRTLSSAFPLWDGGPVVAAEGGIDEHIIEASRLRLFAMARVLGSARALGSEATYATLRLTLRGVAQLESPDGLALERSALAAQVRAGQTSSRTPLDAL